MQVLGVGAGERACSLAIARIVHTRVPIGTLQAYTKRGFLSSAEVYRYIIPKRTLTHRKNKHERLSIDESEKLARIARLTEQAIDTFGSTAKAAAWLRRPDPRFGDKAPLELASTEHGGRVVEETLIQIDEGFFA